MNRIDFVDYYAEKLKRDSSIFVQQKMLLESQMQSSKSFFQNHFKGQDFKTAAREYLKSMGKI